MTDTIIDQGDNHTENSGAPLMAQPDRAMGGNEDEASHTCRFIHPEQGRRCGSPALRNEPFCYHHNEERPRPANPGNRKRRRNTFDLASPDSRTSIQDALGSIFLRIAQNDIDLRRAGLLLYCLQIASANLKASQLTQQKSQETPGSKGTPELEEAPEQGEAPGFSPVKSQPLTRGFSPEPSAAEDHTEASRWKDLAAPESPVPAPSATAPSKGRPISRSTFAALLETLARRQGIDVQKLHHAHDATILLRLNAAADDAQNASAPFIPHHHRGTNGALTC